MGEKDKEMKKLMFVAALAAAFAVSAEGLESKNTVGYQNKEIGAFNLTASTFLCVGGNAVSLGDIVPNAAFIGGGQLQFFTAAGKAGDLLVYVNDPEMLEAFEATAGWYLFADEELTDCKNSTSLTFGSGFIAKCPASGAALTYAGDVKESPTEIPVGTFTMTANCTPVPVTLGDVKPNAAFIGGGLLQFFTSAGKAGDMLVYVNDPEMLEAFEATEGWYLFSDEELTDCKNSTQLNPGDGFIAKAPSAGSTILLPNPIGE